MALNHETEKYERIARENLEKILSESALSDNEKTQRIAQLNPLYAVVLRISEFLELLEHRKME